LTECDEYEKKVRSEMGRLQQKKEQTHVTRGGGLWIPEAGPSESRKRAERKFGKGKRR